MIKNLLTQYSKLIASICSVLALLLFIPAGITDSTPLFIVLVVFVGLLFAGSFAILFLGYRFVNASSNFFLTDAKTNKRRSTTELTCEDVGERMDGFLEPYTASIASLWTDFPQKLRVDLGDTPAFRPLVAYRMLLALSEAGASTAVSIFQDAEERVVSYVCRSIAAVGDKEMADFLFSLKKKSLDEPQRAASFFRNNRARFGERMLAFVKQNIHDFDLPAQKEEDFRQN